MFDRAFISFINCCSENLLILTHTTDDVVLRNSAKAIPKTIEQLEERGYTLVTITELLDLEQKLEKQSKYLSRHGLTTVN